jgi:hypothetical protein
MRSHWITGFALEYATSLFKLLLAEMDFSLKESEFFDDNFGSGKGSLACAKTLENKKNRKKPRRASSSKA